MVVLFITSVNEVVLVVFVYWSIYLSVNYSEVIDKFCDIFGTGSSLDEN